MSFYTLHMQSVNLSEPKTYKEAIEGSDDDKMQFATIMITL